MAADSIAGGGAGLSLWLIFYTLRTLSDNKTDTYKELSVPLLKVSLCQEWARIRSDIAAHPTRLSQVVALLWFDPVADGQSGRLKVGFEDISDRFAGRPLARCIRAGSGTVAMFAMRCVLAPILGGPNTLGRGSLVQGVYFKVNPC
jgi:hypothetical protein